MVTSRLCLSDNAAHDLRAAPAALRTVIRVAGAHWTYGTLTLGLPTGSEITFQGPEPGPCARLQMHDYRMVSHAVAGGDIGLGETFMAGQWDTPDLAEMMGAFSMNFDRIRLLVDGNLMMQMANRLTHWLRPNTRNGSRRNIHAHYDLGNAFYARWLDPSMTYSSARFERQGQSLPEAQRNKYAQLARTLELGPGQSVLEIGCGWGGFAEFAAKEIDAKVTAITISRAQHDFARERMFRQGLSEKVDIRLIDYRDVEGQFDKVASIEMFEAVGEAFWPTFFTKVRNVLAPGGQAGLQVITIRDELFSHYRRRADFIQKYIFPGGMLPSESRLREETRRAGLEWKDVSRFGQNYADTLAEWGRRFEAAWDDIRGLGFDERFRRLWRFYLGYCEAGFRTERTNVIQLGLARI